MANLSDQQATVKEELGFVYEFEKLLLNNYCVKAHDSLSEITLKPYETRVYCV
jgi:alpha-glucosidase